MPTVEEMRQQLMAAEKQSPTPSVEEMRQQLMDSEFQPPAVVQKTHDDISWLDRAVIKNFGGSDKDAIMYLKDKYKDKFQIEKINDQIAIKKPNEKEYRVLDPEGFDAADITDVGFDIAAGIGSGIASAGAGLAGAAGTLGLGAIPAAMAAGGASSAGLETLRQAIGQGLGARQDFDKSDIALTGAVGGFTPFLFGTGAGAARQATALAGEGGEQLARTLLERSGSAVSREMTKSQAKEAAELLAQSQRGVLSLGPKFAQMISGVPAETIEGATKKASPELAMSLGVSPAENKSLLDLVAVAQRNGLSDTVDTVAKKVKDKLWTAKKSLQNTIGSVLEKSQGKVNVQKYKQPILDRIAEIESLGDLNAESLAEINGLNQLIDDVFKTSKTVPKIDPDTGVKLADEKVLEDIGEVGAKRLMAFKQQVKDIAGRFTTGEKDSVQELAKKRAANQIYHTLNGDLNKTIAQQDKLSGGNLMGKYRNQIAIEERLLPIFEDKDRTFSLLRSIDRPTKQMIKETIQKIDLDEGLNIKEAADFLDVWAMFNKPSMDAVSSGSSTSTSRTASAGALGRSIGWLTGRATATPGAEYVGSQIGDFTASKAASPAAIKKYLQAAQAAKPVTGAMTRVNEAPSTISQAFLNRMSLRPRSAPNLTNIAAPSSWLMMQNRGE